MERVKLKDCELDLGKLNNVIALCTFGSYNEDCFDKDRSDIDIMILLKKELQVDGEIISDI